MFDFLKKKTPIREMNSFIYFSQKKWPNLRKKLRYKNKIETRCNLCINSKLYAALNQRGICEACEAALNQSQTTKEDRSTQKIDPAESAALDKLIQSKIGKGDHYDALLLFSGGKDSLFLLNSLIKRFEGLSILAFALDNGFMSQFALDNIYASLKKINRLDFMHFKSNIPKKLASYLLTHMPKEGDFSLIDHYDGFLTFDIGRYIADSLGIPLVFAGINHPQASEYFHSGWECTPENELAARNKILTLDLKNVFSASEEKVWNPNHKSSTQCQLLFPLAVWKTEENAIQDNIVSSGLIDTYDKLHPLITNSRFLPLLWLLDYEKFGYSTTEPKVSDMIRDGKADRLFWLNHYESIEYLSKKNKFLPLCIDQVLADLDLSRMSVGL